jgi:hypothetical protein
MKRVRNTYQCDFHHGMNRGINCEDIFSGSKNNDSYLKMAIEYTLLNIVRTGIVSDFNNYILSSCRDYLSNETPANIYSELVNELFESKTELFKFLQSQLAKELPQIETKYGEISGEKEFIEEAVYRFNRRKRDFGKTVFSPDTFFISNWNTIPEPIIMY